MKKAILNNIINWALMNSKNMSPPYFSNKIYSRLYIAANNPADTPQRINEIKMDLTFCEGFFSVNLLQKDLNMYVKIRRFFTVMVFYSLVSESASTYICSNEPVPCTLRSSGRYPLINIFPSYITPILLQTLSAKFKM